MDRSFGLGKARIFKRLDPSYLTEVQKMKKDSNEMALLALNLIKSSQRWRKAV